MEHVFSMLFARSWILQEKIKIKKPKAVWQIAIRKKIVHDPYVSDGPLPPALPYPFWHCGYLLEAMPDRPAAVATVRMLHAGASGGPAGGPWVIWVIWVIVFYCMAMHAGWLALGHLGHCFCIAQMTQNAQIWRPGNSQSLGHLGHLVIDLKLVAGDASAWPYSLYRYIPLYQNLLFS